MFIESFDKTKIWYDYKKKKGPCLIFLHGWANDWTTWKKEIQDFKRKGYSTLTLDLRGHGKSDKPLKRSQYKLDAFAKDVHEIIKKEKIKDFVLIGHSMGGMLALAYYKKYNKTNKPKGLILCDTTYRNVFIHKKIEFLSPFVGHVLDFLLKNKKIHKKHFKHLKEVDLTKYKNKNKFLIFYKGLHTSSLKSVFACLESMMKFDATKMLKKINIPTLIIQGRKDSILPEKDALEMFDKIKGSDLKLVPNGKHLVNLNSPKLVDKYIETFLKKNDLTP